MALLGPREKAAANAIKELPAARKIETG